MAGGVRFDLNSDGVADRLPWTVAGQPIGFLALDRNHNGVIDNGRELFGNYTPLEGDQAAANGFEALAYWDRAEAGGNSDGWIDARDSVWSELRIWIDANHDGLTQPGELYHPSAFSIQSISLAYAPEMRRDQHGNLFRYRSEFVVGPSRRMCYDIFLGAR
ncbi:MAG TPA: hypothetical protein VNN18_03045 [Candidatus Xenobia bacterium]|nr:hypothetical protein [Candidatus Xenobia bacterium]